MRYIRAVFVLLAAFTISGSVFGQAPKTEASASAEAVAQPSVSAMPVATTASLPLTESSEDRTALRALLTKGAEALNSRNFDGIAASLHPNFTILTVDNQKFVGLEAFKKHYLGLFDGPGSMLNKIETQIVADEATRMLDENTGVVYGTSQDTYHFKDGDVRVMKTRWNAVTQKDQGTWKLVNVHFSANLIDNPVLDAAKSYAVKLAAGVGILGLLIGLGVMALMRRRPKA